MVNYLSTNWERLGLASYGPASRFACVLQTPWFSPASRHVIAMVLDDASGEPVLVAKTPRLPGDNARLDREIRNLRLAQAAHPFGVASVPRVVVAETTPAGTLLIETALPGRRMSPQTVRHEFSACIEAVISWLIQFQQSTMGPESCDYEELLERPLRRSAHLFAYTPEDECLMQRLREITEPLRQRSVPVVFEHGDLCDPNIVINERGAGILDWENATPRCYPGGDLFLFLAFAEWARAGRYSDADFVRAVDNTFLPAAPWVRPYLRRYVDAIQLDPDLLTPLFVVFWTRYLLNLAERMHDGLAPDARSALLLRRTRYYQVWRHVLQNSARMASPLA